MRAVLDGLVHSLKTISILVEGDSQLIQVPGKFVDCLGQELSLEDAICAILEESSVKFKDKPISRDFAISTSKRKSILRRLRPSMTGCNYNVTISTPSATTKVRETRSRIRLLNVQDSNENLCYGLIKQKDSYPNWIAPYSVSKHMHSEGRRTIISLLVMAILDEPESEFDVRIVTYILSRFPVGEIIGMRNDLYRQERISILEKHRRAFMVDLAKKKPDLMFTEVSHEAVHKTRLQMKSLPTLPDDFVGSKLFRAICSKEDHFTSQGALAAAVQMLIRIDTHSVPNTLTETQTQLDAYEFMQCQTQSDEIAPKQDKGRDDNDADGLNQRNCGTNVISHNQTVCAIDGSNGSDNPRNIHTNIMENVQNEIFEHHVDSNSLLVPRAMSRTLQTNLRRNSLPFKNQAPQDIILGTQVGNMKADSLRFNEQNNCIDICDEDRTRLEAEWVQEANIRRLREHSALSYYKSQAKPVFAAILEWVVESGSKGLTSYDIGKRASEHGFSGDQIVFTIVELMKEGVLHRFGCGNAADDGKRAPAIYMATSYAWIFTVVPMSGVRSANREFMLDWGRARPISPWLRVNGQFNTMLVKNVQVHILNVAAKRPGVEENHLVASVISREPILSERAVL
eukprot:IDg13191t1